MRLARISHTHGPKRTPRNRKLLSGVTVPREARTLTGVTGCGMGDTDLQPVAVKEQVSQVRHHARWRRQPGNADLWSAQPAGGGRSRVSPHTGMVPVSALSPSQEVAFLCPAALPLSQHCAARPASRGCADRRSAFPCLRVAPPGGMGTMRQFSVRVAPSATRRALPSMRNPSWGVGRRDRVGRGSSLRTSSAWRQQRTAGRRSGSPWSTASRRGRLVRAGWAGYP